MRRKLVLLGILTLVIVCILGVSFRVRRVEASGTIYIKADGSVEGTDKIQREGNLYTLTDNIYDEIVVQRDNIVIDGTGHTVQGTGSGTGFLLEDRNSVAIKNTQIEQFNTGISIDHSANNIVSQNTLKNNYVGINVFYSAGSIISKNNITPNNDAGIWLWYSSSNNLTQNNIANNLDGILLHYSPNNRLRGNTLSGNSFSFGVSGWPQTDFVNDVDVSNTVDGKPVYYWVSRYGGEVPSDAGYVALVNCRNSIVKDLDLQNNVEGTLIAYSENIIVTRNKLTNNKHGIDLWQSSNITVSRNDLTGNDRYGINLDYSSGNNITQNSIANNYIGIYIRRASDNTIYHNDFVMNSYQVLRALQDSVNVFDDGYPSGGNYWSDYVGLDSDGDGIGDTPYVIDANNTDRYPLMSPRWTLLVSDGFDYPVGIPNGEGYYFAQDFGDWNEDYGGYHLGEDWNRGSYDDDLGDPVYAVSNGKITYARDAGSGWGNVIIINHTLPDGSTVQSMYAHLRYGSLLVSEGDTVTKGTKIGEIGKGYNDNEYWAHLHFEIRFPNCGDWGQPGPGYSLDLTGWADPSDFLDTHRQLHSVEVDEKVFNIGAWTNSNLSNFGLNPATKTLTFKVEGPSGTSGFSNVTIPKELLRCDKQEDWKVIVDTTSVSPDVTQDEDFTYVYFTYTHSQKTVYITGTHVIPEFPSFLILPLFIIATLLAVIVYRRKQF